MFMRIVYAIAFAALSFLAVAFVVDVMVLNSHESVSSISQVLPVVATASIGVLLHRGSLIVDVGASGKAIVKLMKYCVFRRRLMQPQRMLSPIIIMT